MPVAPVVPDGLRHAPFRGSDAVALGLITPDQLRGAAWRRLFNGVYVHRDVPLGHTMRARAAVENLLPKAVVTGVSAATVWEVNLAGPDDDIELTVPPWHGPVRAQGLRVRRAWIADEFLTSRAGVPVTTPEATALRLAAARSIEEAVIAVDRLIVSGLADLAPVRRLAAALTGPSARRVQRVCALANGLAESPQETRLRLPMGASGLPMPVAQFRVRRGGVFVAKVDLAWPDRQIALEYDGLWHAESGQFGLDRARLNRLREAGWTVVFVTAADLHRPAQLLARIATALAG